MNTLLQTSSGASSAAALGVASCSLSMEVTTRERTAKQEGIRPVPYLLTVFSPLVSPQLMVSATKEPHPNTQSVADISSRVFFLSKHNVGAAFTLFLLISTLPSYDSRTNRAIPQEILSKKLSEP